MALCRGAFGSERQRHANARPKILGTDPKAAAGVDEHRRGNQKEGEEPALEHQVELSVEVEHIISLLYLPRSGLATQYD